MMKINPSKSLEKTNYSSRTPIHLWQSTELIPLRREKIISKFTQEELDSCWESLSTNIIQNYQRGKGTLIKGFGTFTYKGPEINLEGTTNEIIRDKKERLPIFLVSKEFNENLKSGEYTKQYGIRYFTTKENKNIPISNINYTEIAFSLCMSKDKVSEIIKHLILYIKESIIKKKFKNKIMPGLGVLILKQNILAVKFNENFEYNIKDKNRKLNNLKNNISLNRCFDEAKELEVGTCPDIYKTSESIKATNSLTTECQQSAKKFLKNKYSIQILNNSNLNPQINTLFDSERKDDIYYKNNFFSLKNYPFTFLNDSKKKTLSSSRNKVLKTDFLSPRSKLMMSNNPLQKLDNITLKNMNYFKGTMIKDCKDLDINKTGSITKEETITMLINNIPDINHELAKEIVEHYFVTDQIDYMKFIASIIKGSKNSFIKKKHYFNFANFLLKKKKTDSINSNNNIMKKNMDLKSIIQKQKDKKIAKIKKAEIEIEKMKEKEKKKKKFEEQKEMFFQNKQKVIERNKKELKFLFDLIPEIKIKYAVLLDQNINTEELMRILKKHDIFYTKDRLEEILKFVEIKDLEKFSLNELINNIQICKIISTSIDTSHFSNILNQIKDIIYMHGGEKFLFNNEINKKDTIDLNTFILLLKDKSSLGPDILKNAFYYIVKTSRNMTIDDYNEYFASKNINTNIYDEQYLINMMKTLILKISEKFMNPQEYFDHLLSYNINTQLKVISRINWIKYMQLEKYDFHAEELDHLFNWIDTKKDNVIDLEEFIDKYHYTIKPLNIMKNIIHNNKLDIEDLAHRMKIDVEEIKKYDYTSFFNHVKRLDYTLPESFIRKIFDELKQEDKSTGKEFINSKKFLDAINYVRPPEIYQSFTKKYIDTVKDKTTYEFLKTQFEKFDRDSLGNMTKLEYVKSMSKIFPEFNDDDHMRFVRIMDVLDRNNKVIYPEILNIIFYCNVNKMNDQFTKICEFLIDKLNDECENNVEKLMYLIESGSTKKKSLNLHKPLTIKQLEDFLIKSNISIDKKVIQKLDIDSDGLISYDDLYGVLLRYRDTLYFKYYNNSNNANINLFTKDFLPQEKIKVICEKLLSYMKSKNITPYGLFKKFDRDNNGLISNIDFNQVIKEILNINSALADPFFAYLDYYNIGMVDFETFNSRINYADKIKLSENDRKEENEILEKIKEFVVKNCQLSDNEIFQIMDKDSDGLINSNDLMQFAKENLEIIEKDFNISKIERVMMSLSLTKNLQVGFNDISEFIKIKRKNKISMNLKEIFEATANQNLSQKKKNVSWINDIIERFGMYVSEKYDSIEQFYNESIEEGSNKFKFSDFIRFHESHYDLFNNGFHLSKDELLSIFTSLDSQKKNFLSLQDLQNKLQYFNFYKKMHFDIKDFFQTNFQNGVDAFKYFLIGKNNNGEKRYFITIKEFFDGFENFFPNKYENNTILKYLSKYFNITLPINDSNKNNLENKKDTIDFSEFNYIYFDSSEENKFFLDNFSLDTKLINKRTISDDKKINSEKNFFFSDFFKKKQKKNESLMTPFDTDPFIKFIRIINSSKYDINSFFEEAIKENSNNPYVNKSQLRHIIKKLNIGLTNLEIELIVKKCSKEISTDFGEKINLRKLLNILNDEFNYSDLGQGIKNISNKISEIKTLIYKFYSSPILCFQIIDVEQNGRIDFQKYRNLIIDLYTKNEEEIPNFTLIKNTFDTIDLRKDGIIDYNEWSKSFSMVNGKLDLAYEKYSNDVNELNSIKKYKNELRQWENSDDITQKYLLIYKNRKQIKSKLIDNNFIINKNGKQYVNSETLILVIQKMLPTCKLSRIQWKMLTNIGKNSGIDNLVCISDFFRLIEITTQKNNNFKPYKSSNGFNKIYYGNFESFNTPNRNLSSNKILKKKEFYGNKTITTNFSQDNKFKIKI